MPALPPYQRIYADRQAVAYAPASGGLDHLFVYAAADPAAEPAALAPADLFARWSRPPVANLGAGPVPRAIFFCQRFDRATTPGHLDALDLSLRWGLAVYWSTSTFAGGSPDATFPTTDDVPITVGELGLLWKGRTPHTLDDFTLSLDEGAGQLRLGLPAGTSGRIVRVGWPIATSLQFTLTLAAPGGFVAGAVGVAVDWPPGRDGDHPLRSVGFVYESAPEHVPGQGDDPVFCPTLRAELADEVDAGGTLCTVALDPRDKPGQASWLTGQLNSRMEPGRATLRSSLFGTKGQRIHLRSAGGVARLGFLFELMQPGGDVTASESVIFHPEGAFDIVNGPLSGARPAGATGIGALDVMAGAVATEFLDLATVDAAQIHFSRGPAFLGAPGELTSGPPASKLPGPVITSYLQFADDTGKVRDVPLHSQPAAAPLFVVAQGAQRDLPRRREPLGLTGLPLPIFPWAGFRGPDAAEAQAIEATHLSPVRRAQLPAKALAVRDAMTSTVGVTPQGVLAEVTPEGYTRLLFGNADTAAPQRLEFEIAISGNTPEFREFQKALAGNQLFVVIDRPTPDALQTIRPSALFHIRDFAFKLQLRSDVPAALGELPPQTVLLMKYFRGKSLAELVQDPTTWACRRFLATGTPDDVARLAHLGADASKRIAPGLESIWSDPNWQGVLALNLGLDRSPAVVEALEPGIVGELRVHHFGISAPTVRRDDLVSPKPRAASAFGLINYSKPAKDPCRPETGDREPGTDAGGREYRFTVNALELGFQSSQISTFKADLDVEFTHLFWDPGTLSDGKLKLVGSYERRPTPHGDEDVFSLRAARTFHVDFQPPSRLRQFTIRQAQLSIVSVEGEGANRTITAFIGLDGDLELNDALMPLPLFKVKRIVLRNVGFAFKYRRPQDQDPGQFSFGFQADSVAAELEFDAPTVASSLLEWLPVKIKGMAVAVGSLLDLRALQFQPIQFAGLRESFHFGFVLEMDLGSLGRLAGDARGLRVPMILGWGGGSSRGVAFGIRFPAIGGALDIGIQQFIRLRARRLELVLCGPDGARQSVAIKAVGARIVMFGREWPDADTSIAMFVPLRSGRRMSWALGVTPASGPIKYIGGGQRLTVTQGTGGEKTTKDIVERFQRNLGDVGDVCALSAKSDSDGWTIVAHFDAGVEAWLAIADGDGLYGLRVTLPVLGDVDVLYRRLSDELGILSAEYALPGLLRQIQFGALSVRLPAIRLEIHTDGGALLDGGFPWRNDFSRSAQAEVGIFLGSGGFYYGRTSALAADLLQFTGGYGFGPPDPAQLTRFRALSFGFALRVGIGRSFSIGILSAEASLSIFGGLEGAAAYPNGGGGLLEPPLYALRGFVGLMIDITAQVQFAIIRARARILVYAMVGLEIRRVLGKAADGTHHLLTLPIVLFAEVGIRVELEVRIRIGCVSITIHLAYSATWRLQETIGELSVGGPLPLAALPGGHLILLPFAWNPAYRFWTAVRDLDVFVTVLPCLADGRDIDGAVGVRTCAVGQLLLPLAPTDNGFADLVKFLLGWVLRPQSASGIADNEPITLAEVTGLRRMIHASQGAFWASFEAALVTALKAQFKLRLHPVSATHADDLFAAAPLWPGTVFRQIRGPMLTTGEPLAHFVVEQGVVVAGREGTFANYSSCVITGALAEIEQLITDEGQTPDLVADTHDPDKFLRWGVIWTRLFAPLTDTKAS